MLTAIIIAIYALGCVLAYGRYIAESIELNELGYLHDRDDIWIIIFSWITFIFMTYIYLRNNSKYFLRF